MSNELSDFLATLKMRYPAETEFHQAVTEVARSVWPFIGQNPKYRKAKILERIVEPVAVGLRVEQSLHEGLVVRHVDVHLAGDPPAVRVNELLANKPLAMANADALRGLPKAFYLAARQSLPQIASDLRTRVMAVADVVNDRLPLPS